MTSGDVVDQDAADLLYRHGVGGVLVSILASSGLALISARQTSLLLPCVWWMMMTIVLAIRSVDIRYYRADKHSLDSRKGRRPIDRFSWGIFATSVLWAAFPLIFLRHLNEAGRATTAIVLSGMVGGGATLLAPSQKLATVFCASLVLPASIAFLSLPGFENTFLGILGCAYFVVMIASSRVTHRATMSAVRLSRANQALVAEMEQERERTIAANIELKCAQAELEQRVSERTLELQRANQMLSQSEDRLHSILDNSPTAVYMKDLEGRYMFANRQFRKFFGEDPAILGKTDYELFSLDAATVYRRNDQLVIKTGAPVETEEMAPHPDGPHVCISVKFPLKAGENELYAVCGIWMDITDRKREEANRLRITAELERERARLQAILQNIPIGVLVTEAESGCVLMANPRLTRILDRDLIPGVRLVDACRFILCQPDGAPLELERHPFPRVLTRGEIVTGEEYLHERANGGTRWVRVSGAPVLTSAGQVSAAVLTLEDVDAEKRAEQGLRRSNNELRQFAYAAAHDLQEPLRNVAVYTEFLGTAYADRLDQRAHQFIQFAIEGAHRMQNLVRDLLAYTRVVDDIEVPDVPVPTNEILQQVLFDLKTAIAESGAEISSESLPNLPVQPVHLRQLFQNLISNALKYRGSQQPRVFISAQKSIGGWTFSVEDNGIGIAKRYHEQIFDVFKRLHGRQYEGTGIGLALCKRIVEHYRGRIWVNSEPGIGSRFSFTLPRENVNHVRTADDRAYQNTDC
ncbi:MAG TPA: ATP-binding protein [Bryobacteraceae bacterium]|nr:ATP-binding protein [Bryobacteraceae bacterium]